MSLISKVRRLLLIPLIALCSSSGTAVGSSWTFVERPEAEVLGQGNVELVSVLTEGGAPFAGTTFTALREEPVAFGPPRYRTLANTGPAARARFTLAPGRYRVLLRNGAVERSLDIDVPETGLLQQAANLDAGMLSVNSRLSVDSDAEVASWFRVLAATKDAFGEAQWLEIAGNGYADSADFLLPAGRYRVEARYGSAVRNVSVDIIAGETTAATLDLDAARIALSAVLTEDEEPVDGVNFRILAADVADTPATNTEITRADATKEANFVLPAGDYVVQAEIDGVQRDYQLTLAAGDDRAQVLVLDAAEWFLSATLTDNPERLPDAGFRVRSAGDTSLSSPLRGAVAPEHNARFVLPAGKYRAMALIDQASADTEITLAAGERLATEIEIDAARVLLSLDPPRPGWFGVFRIDSDASGQRRIRIFNDGYYADRQLTLPAGDYVAFVRLADGRRAERAFRVEAGVDQIVIIEIGP